MSTPRTPADVYAERLVARRATLADRERGDGRIAGARLGVVVAAIAAGVVAYNTSVVTPFVALAFVPVFVVLMVVHERVLRAKARAQRAIAHVERGISRIDDTWRGKGTSGARFLDDAHPFAADLDLFGRASLFELLCTARTRGGEARLAEYLTRPPPADVVRARQVAVRELAPLLDLREDVDALAAHVTENASRSPVATASLASTFGVPGLPSSTTSKDAERAPGAPALVEWALRPNTLPSWTLPVAALLVTTSIACITLDALDVVPRLVPLLAIAAQMVFAGLMRKPARAVLDGVDTAGDELKVLAELLVRVERATFQSPLLVQLQERLRAVGEPPSRVVARLTKHIDRLHQQENQFFLPIALLLLWKIVHAALIARWRAWAGPKLPDWIDVVAELEALLSLSAYAYEHPDDPEPTILDDGPPRLAAAGVGHPLLPNGGVRNDVTLGGTGDHAGPRLYVVSGSNMSGKSTFLRAIGVNVVLALAGGRVRARSLTVSPMAIGATLRVQDSLEKGASRFYAEITRLQVIMQLARERDGRVLFLIDELLAGTNSRDRQVGGAAILQGLVARGAIGLATTHDLALAAVADTDTLRDGKARNVHFQDVIEGDRVVFDYRLRDGVVERSNALALMRAVGLDV